MGGNEDEGRSEEEEEEEDLEEEDEGLDEEEYWRRMRMKWGECGGKIGGRKRRMRN